MIFDHFVFPSNISVIDGKLLANDIADAHFRAGDWNDSKMQKKWGAIKSNWCNANTHTYTNLMNLNRVKFDCDDHLLDATGWMPCWISAQHNYQLND